MRASSGPVAAGRPDDHDVRDVAVLFDVDDTLVDFSGAARAALLDVAALFRAAAVQQSVAAQVVSAEEAVLAAWEAVSEREYERFLAGESTFADMLVSRMAALAREMDPSGALGLDPVELERVRNEAIFTHYRPYPDVADTLQRLREAGVRIAVLSNSDGDYQRRKMAAAGLGALAAGGIFSGDVGVSKPDPEIFLAGARSVGVVPERVVYVGDRWATDALGALGAGLAAVWVNRAALPRPADAGQQLDALPGALDRLAELPDLAGLDVALVHALVGA